MSLLPPDHHPLCWRLCSSTFPITINASSSLSFDIIGMTLFLPVNSYDLVVTSLVSATIPFDTKKKLVLDGMELSGHEILQKAHAATLKSCKRWIWRRNWVIEGTKVYEPIKKLWFANDFISLYFPLSVYIYSVVCLNDETCFHISGEVAIT